MSTPSHFNPYEPPQLREPTPVVDITAGLESLANTKYDSVLFPQMIPFEGNFRPRDFQPLIAMLTKNIISKWLLTTILAISYGVLFGLFIFIVMTAELNTLMLVGGLFVACLLFFYRRAKLTSIRNKILPIKGEVQPTGVTLIEKIYENTPLESLQNTFYPWEQLFSSSVFCPGKHLHRRVSYCKNIHLIFQPKLFSIQKILKRVLEQKNLKRRQLPRRLL